jgi:hypothetical protein
MLHGQNVSRETFCILLVKPGFTGFWEWLVKRSSVARFEEAFVTGGLAPSIKSRGRAVKPKVPRQRHGKNTTAKMRLE